MSSIFDLEVFVRTADTGSLSAAARGLGLTPAAASIALKRLETRLLARSTRSMRLTEEGKLYLDSVRVALATLADCEQALKQQSQGLTGLLQLAAPSDFGRNVLLGWLDEFKQRHPNIRLQLMLNDSNADLFRETVDIALRFGVPQDSSLVALPIAPDHHRVACASPAYLARHGTPLEPMALSHHRALRYMRQGQVSKTWRFRRCCWPVGSVVRGLARRARAFQFDVPPSPAGVGTRKSIASISAGTVRDPSDSLRALKVLAIRRWFLNLSFMTVSCFQPRF